MQPGMQLAARRELRSYRCVANLGYVHADWPRAPLTPFEFVHQMGRHTQMSTGEPGSHATTWLNSCSMAWDRFPRSLADADLLLPPIRSSARLECPCSLAAEARSSGPSGSMPRRGPEVVATIHAPRPDHQSAPRQATTRRPSRAPVPVLLSDARAIWARRSVQAGQHDITLMQAGMYQTKSTTEWQCTGRQAGRAGAETELL